jgi:uncharacterized protein (TIGR02996 family)
MTLDDWLDACAEQPDDLTRQAFADWLEERGESDRAEFVRLQIELVRCKTRAWVKERRAQQLLKRHRLTWVGPLRELAPAEAWEFHRGLPERLVLHFHGLKEQDAARLAASPLLARVKELNLRKNQIGVPGARALAASPYAARLTTLVLGSNQIGPRGAGLLAASPHLSRLQELNLWNNEIGNAAAQALASSRSLDGLTRLDLEHNQITDQGAEALANSRNRGRWTQLNLEDNQISYSGRQALQRVFGKRVRLDGQRSIHGRWMV